MIHAEPAAWYPAGYHMLDLGSYAPGLYFCLAETEGIRTGTRFTVIR
jgi:hypothetical protein